MTSHERLLAIFRGDIPDRPAIKLWSAGFGQEMLHPDYKPVYEAAIAKLDLFVHSGSSFNLHWGMNPPPITVEEQPTASPEWVDVVTTVTTPLGAMRSVYRKSMLRKPGYDMEHLIKEPADLDKLLSVPYVPFPFNAGDFRKTEKDLGDRGLVCFGLDHGP